MAKITNIYYRISNAIKIGIWAFKNPQSIQESNMKMLSDLFGLILKVAKESRPYMTSIAYVHPDTKDNMEIVAIWAGAGIGADPNKRIGGLHKEISSLKAQLINHIDAGGVILNSKTSLNDATKN